MVQRPDLFRAVVCSGAIVGHAAVSQALAGASWVAEYGNPDDPMGGSSSQVFAVPKREGGVKMPKVLFRCPRYCSSPQHGRSRASGATHAK